MDKKETTQFRGFAATLNYYAPDCPDLQFVAKEVSRDMSNPSLRSWKKLKRAARYLVGREALVWKYVYQAPVDNLTVWIDSDWGGSREMRKSTSGGAVMWGSHCWKTWSTTQGATALSSAEAEFYAMVDGVQRSKYLCTIASELGVSALRQNIILGTDSEAAKSFVARRGLGRMRHIEVRDLWLQEEVRKGNVTVTKLPGTENAADLMTKYLSRTEVGDRLAGLSVFVKRPAVDVWAAMVAGRRLRWADDAW